jgi:rhodanese-related sulfurtransferase
VLRTDETVTHHSVVANLRDVGDLPTETGGRTRPQVLLRSAAPLAGDDDPDGFDWPPAEVIDYRSPAELKGHPHPLTDRGARVHALPMLTSSLTWEDMPDLATVYPRFMRTGAPVLVQTLRIVAHADGPALVHCAAGKDRTGIATAVLLRAAGVTRDAVIADYTRTAANMVAVEARLDTRNGPEDPTHRQRLMGAPAEAITVVLDELDRAGQGHPDPAGAWLLTHGASAEDLAAWRRRMVG